MDKTKATVVMPLTEYEKLDRYKDTYNKLIRQIRYAAYVGIITSQGFEIVVDTQKISKILAEYVPENCGPDSFPYEDIKFTWIGG